MFYWRQLCERWRFFIYFSYYWFKICYIKINVMEDRNIPPWALNLPQCFNKCFSFQKGRELITTTITKLENCLLFQRGHHTSTFTQALVLTHDAGLAQAGDRLSVGSFGLWRGGAWAGDEFCLWDEAGVLHQVQTSGTDLVVKGRACGVVPARRKTWTFGQWSGQTEMVRRIVMQRMLYQLNV